MILLRNLKDEDIKEAHSLGNICYPLDLHESLESFQWRFKIYSEGCRGAWVDNVLCGYIVAHIWKLNEIVYLNDDSYGLPKDADCMYIHDVAIHPLYHNKHLGSRLVSDIITLAVCKNIYNFAGVAIKSTEGYWKRWGFSVEREFYYTVNVPAFYMTCKKIPLWRG